MGRGWAELEVSYEIKGIEKRKKEKEQLLKRIKKR
jgi:hypothetical protein